MKIVIAVLALVAALVGALLWFSGPLRYYPGPNPREAARVIRTALPPGTAKERVIAYLADQKIEHSEFLSKERRIYAIRRNTCHALFVECSLDMVFNFNEAGELSNTSIAEGFTGL
jgi:hypothetical protein